MSLPDPLPDNPLRWDGWKHYQSDNFYQRLCLDFEHRPGEEQITDHYRRLLIWWQKKLPLKNQPSNPMAQVLRSGLDDAPVKLSEARSALLDPASRAKIDEAILQKVRDDAITEFNKYLAFALTTGELDSDEERSLYLTGEKLGLSKAEMVAIIDAALKEKGLRRAAPPAPAPPAPAPAVAPEPVANAAPLPAAPANPAEEFLRMLRLSGVDELTDDQRDAFCNMGEALGLTGGQAEDVIDDYLDERMLGTPAAVRVITPKPSPQPDASNLPTGAKPVSPFRPAARVVTPFIDSPLRRAEEKKEHPPFTNRCGLEMLLIPSGSFLMGSESPGAAANEQPPTPTNLSAFYLSRWPVTNAQYEQFAPDHRGKRAPWASDHHPVVYVSAREAEAFCEWLSRHEGAPYRLPTEAEWEYAARGPGRHTYPWGEHPPTGAEANFADANTTFAWADRSVDDGFAQSSPVGTYPKGASPFGVEDLAGNVWEWCFDDLTSYTGKERTNPRGRRDSGKRICRGGSWKSRLASLRTSARSFNAPTHAAHDIGFRVVREIKTA
ncbi:MAG TPA: formylglycine-generating enzyme family protein [Chthoniobacteraceae bacterium]|nr:formylglycine-generating enzyme family protein [Chthoniobacteraceae bacterium]